MDKVYIAMVAFTKEDGKMIKNVGVDISNFQINKVMSVDGCKIILMVKVFLKQNIQYIKVNLKTQWKMAMVHRNLQMVSHIKDNLNKIYLKV